ncbi:hypothetical protein I3760_07G102000 [Carya illinoinensis]|nr:hypothetical protein I3760_07G102000 [Carya illinoinensis]
MEQYNLISFRCGTRFLWCPLPPNSLTIPYVESRRRRLSQSLRMTELIPKNNLMVPNVKWEYVGGLLPENREMQLPEKVGASGLRRAFSFHLHS